MSNTTTTMLRIGFISEKIHNTEFWSDNGPSWTSGRGKEAVEKNTVSPEVRWSDWDSDPRSPDLQLYALPNALWDPATLFWTGLNLSSKIWIKRRHQHIIAPQARRLREGHCFYVVLGEFNFCILCFVTLTFFFLLTFVVILENDRKRKLSTD